MLAHGRKLALLIAGIAVMPMFGALPSPRPSLSGSAHVARESRRLRAHFDSVDRELRARDVGSIDAVRRANRATLIGWLREYRDAQAFPRNEGQSPRSTPIFRDREGRLCAMAYLIDRSGRHDIVDAIARTQNLDRIHAMAARRELVAWLDSTGLALDEAARIQPTYDAPPRPAPAPYVEKNVTVATVGSAGLSVGTSAWALARPSTRSTVTAIVTGAASMMIGATHFAPNFNHGGMGMLDIALGSASVATGVWQYNRLATQRVQAAAAPRVRVIPGVAISAGTASPGFLVRAEF